MGMILNQQLLPFLRRARSVRGVSIGPLRIQLASFGIAKLQVPDANRPGRLRQRPVPTSWHLEQHTPNKRSNFGARFSRPGVELERGTRHVGRVSRQ
jgi:hypothetical protein